VVLTHALDWPSLTCQWLPVTQPVHGGDYVEHKLLLGTHVDPEAAGREDRNYLMIATIRLPSPDAELKVTGFDEERGELGGYGGSLAKVEISMKINHPTEVNRARYCPGNPFLLATKTASSDVLLFDYSKHPSIPTDDAVRPALTLVGHKKEGYGLAWSPHAKNLLLSGSDDGLVCCWDVQGGLAGGGGGGGGGGASAASSAAGGRVLRPSFTLEAHASVVVEDVAWHATHAHLFGTVSDDKELRIWDTRSLGGGGAQCVSRTAAHAGETMCLSFHPTKDHLVATGGTDKQVRLWDSRRLEKPVHTMLGHEDHVLALSWSPFSESHLASSGQDRRVVIWDTARIGADQAPEDAEDGPPEMLVRMRPSPPTHTFIRPHPRSSLSRRPFPPPPPTPPSAQFVHGGHSDRIADFSWNEKSQWFFASVADDNVLQVWQPAENLLFDEDGEGGGGGEDEEEEGEGGGGGGGGKPAKKPRVADSDLE
jgi:histone-binding protein RBBP4